MSLSGRIFHVRAYFVHFSAPKFQRGLRAQNCVHFTSSLLFRSKKQRGGGSGGGLRGAISSLMCTFKNALGGGGGGGGGGNGAASSNNNSGGSVRSTIRNSSSGNLNKVFKRKLELGARIHDFLRKLTFKQVYFIRQ